MSKNTQNDDDDIFENDDDYIAQYTYPPVTIDFGNADSKNEELDSCIDDQYLSDIKDRILEEAMNFREVIEFQFSSHNCQTIQDYNDNNLVSLTKKRIKEENLTKEQRKAKREAKQQSRQENREEQKAEFTVVFGFSLEVIDTWYSQSLRFK